MKLERIIWITIFLIGFGVRSTELFHPIDRTEWRESDMASIARNYYWNGMDFLHPQVDWGGTGPGYTESEFPVYPYMIALSYKLFGVYEPTGRIISFLFSLFTMIIFFRFSKYLFNTGTALAVSSFFTLSPLLMVTSNSIQPESIMFFFYICAAFAFMCWMSSQSRKDYLYTLLFTASALLCKITAVNIGILFVLIILIQKGWRFLLNPKVIILGMGSILPSVIWYTYSHRFYLLYGNSLGLSNEYGWAGLDFFTNSYFFWGIINQEIMHVWTLAGLMIIALALFSTKMIKNKSIILPFCWLIAVTFFYIIASRITADRWAYYYHIFSVPSASILLGISFNEIYERYFKFLKLKTKLSVYNTEFLKLSFITPVMILLLSLYVVADVKYLIHNKPAKYHTSEYYSCKNDLSEIIPEGSLTLATGGPGRDADNFPLAFNASYFFYWLDRKGFNICEENQSVENVIAFREKGADYYIAETQSLNKKPGYEELLRKSFIPLLECNGIILFKLNK